MRMLSLAAFAVLALAIGAYQEDEMTLLIGGASALAAVAALPRWKISTFLTLLCDLFAIETVLFGLADLVALMGYWPKSLEEYELPSYLPLATALFILAIFAVSHFRLVRRMMRIADPFFAARTPISIRPLPSGPVILRQDLYARINVYFLILINQFQVALALRFNFFQRDFATPFRSPTKRTGSRSGTSSWSYLYHWRRSPSSPASSNSSSPRISYCNGAAG
jgi:vitamin B12/bleomycin/antimicrobial peptide transport system ATP-binding/permease protein